MGSDHRAQAAIEFLITNGWAILVVVILLAVLFYIGVLSPQNTTPNTCLFQPGFSCYTFKVGNGTGSLELDFGQATGRSIQVTGISCSQNATAALHTSPLAEDVTVPSGEHRWITGGTSNNSGIICEGATGVAGTRYKGTACVNYTESGTNAQRLVCGEINARLEPASIPSGSPTTTPFPTPPPGAVLIDTCPFTIDTTGYYYLNSSLNDESGSGCVTITAAGSNSILDCYGKTITGTSQGGSGVYITYGITSVTVRHCNINSFWAGIYTEGANDNSTIDDNTAYSNYMGILSSGFTNSRITNNDVSSNLDSGMILYSSSDNNLTSNTANSNVNYGLGMWDSYYNTITGNTINANSYYGFYMSSPDNNLTGNTACWNQGGNIYCDAGQNDLGGNVCTPYEESVCLDSITCHATCPPPPPPACAPGFVVSTCPCTLTVPGDYTLESDLNETLGGDCIDIMADDAHLDCQHHSITGVGGGAGIMVYNWITSSTSGVTVENCNVGNFSFGIFPQNVGNSSITGNTVSSNSEYGIFLVGSSGNNLSDNDATSNYVGIYLVSSSDNNTVTGNSVLGNSYYGFEADSGSTNNLLTENTICWNQNGDFQCDAPQTEGNGNICTPYEGSVCSSSITCNPTCPPPNAPACAPGWVVSACPCTLAVPGNYTLESDLNSTGGVCIDMLSGASGSTLDCQGHNITGAGNGIGIDAYYADGIAIKNCTLGSFDYGIHLVLSNDSTITGNTATSNNQYGIVLYSSNGNNLTSNNASLNNYYGIYSDSYSSNNLFTGNSACSNTNKDVYCEVPQNDGGGNTCLPVGDETSCSYSVSCGGGCPLPPPPACAPDWVISSCGCALDVPGNYTLESDLVSTGSDCLSIPSSGSGASLDCQGHSIIGAAGSSAINVQYAGSVAIQNCNMINFSAGIYLWESNHDTIRDNNASLDYDGIYMYDSNRNIFTNNNFSSNSQYGFYLSSSSQNNSFTGNTATGNHEFDFQCGTELASNDYGNTCGTQSGCESWITSCGVPSTCSSTSITDCCVIRSPGSYSLANDISAPNTCIIITPAANGMVLDCGGKSIIGPGSGPDSGSGIYMKDVSGVTVRDCNVSNFNTGIYSDYTMSNVTIEGNTATSNTFGITSNSFYYCTIRGNTANSNSWYGIGAGNFGSANITGNTANSNGEYGIVASYGHDSNITGNTASLNGNVGIYLDGISATGITGNTLHSNGGNGIEMTSSGNNDFSGNTVTGSASYDFACLSSETNNDLGNTCGTQHNCDAWFTSCGITICNSSITDCCTITSPGSYYLSNSLTSSSTCILVRSGANGSTLDCRGHSIRGPGSTSYEAYGIRLSGASGVTVENCNVTNFGKGIRLDSGAAGNLITGNNASSDTSGIELMWSNGNTISGNSVTADIAGIWLGGNGNTVSGNNATSDISDGILLYYSEENRVSGNIANSNSNYGIRMVSSRNTNLTSNTATGNGNYDFYCDGSGGRDLGDNFCSNKDSCDWLTCH